MRDLVIQLDDCDNILVNFLASHVTRRPPITVAGRPMSSGRRDNAPPSSETPSFYRRQYCIRRFTEQFGYMPLLRSSVRFEPLLHRDPVSVFRKKYRQMENGAV